MSEPETVGGSATVEEVWDLIEQTEATDNVAFTVLAAMTGEADLRAQIDGTSTPTRPAKTAAARPDPVLAYVRAINVEGFRGVGPQASLVLDPQPGLTVVSGRNGSGKSSFAEAFEFAVTGRSYRWENKSKVWKDAWRNLHHGNPCRIGVELMQEPGEAGGDAQRVLIAAKWDDGGELDDATTWSRVAGGENQPVSALGWDRPADLYRPILSYDEIGGLFEERQSALYDALNKILGLDEITDATARINAAIKEIGDDRKHANALRLALRKVLSAAEDPRAKTVSKALASKPYKLDVAEQEIAGAESPQQRLIQTLKSCSETVLPDQTAVDKTVSDYRSALEGKLGAGEAALDLLAQRTTLLREAQGYVTATSTADCPVCEAPLPDAWQERASAAIAENEAAVAAHSKVFDAWTEVKRQVTDLLASVPDVEVDGDVLAEAEAYRHAVLQLRNLPDAETAIADHVASTWPTVVAAHRELTAAAAQRAADLTDAWAPLVEEIATWLSAEKAARTSDDALDNLTAAKKWLTENGAQLREQRMRPIVDSAREIWAQLKQESDVDLGAIELLGTGNQRRVSLTGSVDGEDTGVLSVMSQGELHALALALFIPRATVGDSPFGFLFLDDPIQAMDPAKIDGFLAVLQEIAKTRQVVVFSHDDRLPTAIRRLSVDATLLEVSREPGSTITVKKAEVTAERYVADAWSLISDAGVPAHVKNAAGPGLFRLAVESAAKQRYFYDRTRTGASYIDAESRWADLKTTRLRVLASLGKGPKDSLGGWQRGPQHMHRDNVMGICTAGVHNGGVLSVDDVRDLRKTVRDLLGTK